MRTAFSRRRIVLGTALVLVLGAGGFAGWMALVRAGVLRYNKWDRRDKGSLRVGDLAPDLEIAAYDGSRLRLGSLWAEKPAVLVFGSCT
jgi:hypothetical protein